MLLNDQNKPMNVVGPRLWGPETFAVLLETENMYTGCGEEIRLWGKVDGQRLDF